MRAGAVLLALMMMLTACGGDDGAGDSDRSGGAAAGRDDVRFCDKAAEAAEILDEAEEFDFDEALAVLEDVAKEAPSEIDGDLELVIEAFRQFAAFMEDGTEPTMDEDELDAASFRLDRYFVDVCGFEDDEADDDGNAAPVTTMTSDDPTDEFDAGMATFEGAELNLEISGAVDASDGNYDPFIIECTLWADGDFWLQVYPNADQWSFEINATGDPDLATGSREAYHSSAAPPFGSEEGQSGLYLLGETGTLTIDRVGAIEEIGDGSKTAEVSGRFEVEMSDFADPSAEATATGTFACLTAILEF